MLTTLELIHFAYFQNITSEPKIPKTLQYTQSKPITKNKQKITSVNKRNLKNKAMKRYSYRCKNQVKYNTKNKTGIVKKSW